LAIIAALAAYFDVPKSKVTLEHGGKSKLKVFKILLLISLLFLPAFASDAAEIISPTFAYQGKVIKVEIVSAEAGLTATGAFLGQKFKLFPSESGYKGIVGIPIDQKIGQFPLAVTLMGSDNKQQQLIINIDVSKTVFPISRFWLPPARNKLRARTIVDDEWGRIEKVLLVEEQDQRWGGKFVLPVQGERSQSFGQREIINNKPAGNHRGVDLAVNVGTAVKAPNSGKVVFAGKLNAFGGTMVVDHGQGIHTLYFHLSKFVAKVGDLVKPGTIIALSGNTGISSGAHLHWAMSVHDLRVDPLQWTQQEL